MRLDKFLKVSRIIKRRTVADEACAKKRVSVNGNVAKSGKDIKPGDEIEVRFGSNTLKVKVLQGGRGPCAKKTQALCMKY